MKVFPGSSSRIILLVVLLLVTCYFADWTDDYNSYYNAARYASFETANGPRRSVSGGSMFSSSMTAALAARSSTTAQDSRSALDEVFSGPIGLPQSDADDMSSRSTARAFNPFTKGMSAEGLGGSGSGLRRGMSNNAAFGLMGGGSGLGFSGSSAMSAAPMFGGAQ